MSNENNLFLLHNLELGHKNVLYIYHYMLSPSIQINTHSFHFVDHRQTGTEDYRSCCNNLHISYHHNCYIRHCSSCTRWNTVDRTFPHNIPRTCQSDILQYISPIFCHNLTYIYCIVCDTCHHRFPPYIHQYSILCYYRYSWYNLYCMRENNQFRNVWNRILKKKKPTKINKIKLI